MPVTYRPANPQTPNDTTPADAQASGVPPIPSRRRAIERPLPKAQPPELVSIKRAAQILAVSVSTIHRLKNKGCLKYRHISSSRNSPIRFEVRELLRYSEAQIVDRSELAALDVI